MMIHDVDGDYHAATVHYGEVGDEYPSIRLVQHPTNIGKVAEAYMEKISYWTISEERAEAFTIELVKRFNEYEDNQKEIAELKEKLDEFTSYTC